ncbi:hypothetical protein V8D89_002570 [Ganoderma adspersum]
MAQVLKQRMPLLTYLAILYCYPNIQTLEFDDTYFHIPVAPLAYTSLRYLKLKHCTVRPPPGTGGSVRAFCTVQNTLGSFPNLETLSLVYSLSDNDPRGNLRTLPQLESKIVHLPRLRHFKLEDTPAYILLFISHLVFPPTASLVLEPAYTHEFSQQSAPVLLLPGINPFPTPTTAELSLYLYRRQARSCDEYVVRWETVTGDGVHPIRVAHSSASRQYCGRDTIARFTCELVAALALAPAPGVNSLAVQPSATYLTTSEWKGLMLELPGLRSLPCTGSGWWTTKTLINVLRVCSDSGGEFPCAHLTDLALGWSIPYQACSGEGIRDWELLRQHDDAVTGPHRLGPTEGSQSWLATSLSEFCDILRTCFIERVGRCAPIRRLSVSPCWVLHCPSGSVLEGWQAAWFGGAAAPPHTGQHGGRYCCRY